MAAARAEVDAHHAAMNGCSLAPCGISCKRIDPQGALFFQNFKEQILLLKPILSVIIYLYLFSQLSAQNFFPKARAVRALPPTLLLLAPPERIRRAKRGAIFIQNEFALFLEYPTGV